MTTRELLQKWIAKDERRIRGLLRTIDPKIALTGLVRELDLSYLAGHGAGDSDSSDEAFGVPLLLTQLDPDAFRELGWPALLSAPGTDSLFIRLVRTAGAVARVRRWVLFERQKLIRLVTVRGRPTVYIPPRGMGVERFEMLDHREFYRDEITRLDRDAERLRVDGHAAAELVDRHSFPWRQHFMGYSAHPFLDEYFDALGANHVARISAPYGEVFSDSALFGGVKFGVYKSVMRLFAALAIKRAHFGGSLLRRYSHLRARNVFTGIVDLKQMVDSVSSWFGEDFASEAQVTRIVNEFAWRADRQHRYEPGDTIAPLFRMSPRQALLSIKGCLSNPFYYMLMVLRSRHRRDWDAAVGAREAAFQQEVGAVLRPYVRYAPRSVNLSENGRVLTDVDAVAYEPSTRVLGLFQLKWQDPFGHSAAERRSRASNLLVANAWVESVLGWLARNDSSRLLRMAKLPVAPVDRVLLFVVSRYAANFSGRQPIDERASWSSLPLFSVVARPLRDQSDLLATVHRRLKAIWQDRADSETPPQRSSVVLDGKFVDVTTTLPCGARARWAR